MNFTINTDKKACRKIDNLLRLIWVFERVRGILRRSLYERIPVSSIGSRCSAIKQHPLSKTAINQTISENRCVPMLGFGVLSG